ncbi:amino acid adenylation domain-containing protein [Rhodopirellula halodulae]|uniref:amino acid adenylation domain-containing protein n=1 Tax=Rhodopirellula halodulae TaxID=2894198 RepID=UPI001E298D9D|nr:amino acid adenylation domain-containing protein [Rhodopirellula sp. JC737]MCC9657552.1 amino acid adenylation domain-containing protein [Rhodopirellula sp. JC737]
MSAATTPPPARPFIDLFWQQCDATPDRIAVVQGDQEWTYRELRVQSCLVAEQLKEVGVCPGDRVGMCLDRTPIAIASMLGTHLAGAAFVPLDPDYPADRLQYMVDDADIRTLIGHAHHRSLFPGSVDHDHAPQVDGDQQRLWLDADRLVTGNLSSTTFFRGDFPDLDSDHLAYVMYTSGSTGRPKGVLINHTALTTYCLADCDIYRLLPNDRTLQFSTLTFDIAMEEIFPPLLVGSCVVVRPLERADSVNELSHLIQQHQITAIHLATAYWHEWVDLMIATDAKVPDCIRLMVVTGEKISVDHYQRWLSICESEVLWCNAYGPTEATVSATVFIPDGEFSDANMPIGKPLPGYEALILDSDMREVAMGETGQLFLAGPALADGYLNRPDLTEAAFVQHTDNTGVQRRLYRTGDVARWMPDGNIDFGGRLDHQIKLGSYRIEPGEIEAALTSITNVSEALVRADKIDGQTNLIAFVALCFDSDSQVSYEQSSDAVRSQIAHDLREQLREELPAYMIPSRFVLLDRFPKTINGKIDRSQLPDHHAAVVARDNRLVAPRTELEHRLHDIWCTVLQIPEMGIDDDFFLLGGSSLLVTQVVAKIKDQLGIELPVRDFFANPTIELAARHLQSLMRDQPCSANNDSSQVEAQRARLPQVEAFFFRSGSHDLFGVHYTPPANQPVANRSVVICHSIGHEYQRSYRNLQQLSVHLTQQGWNVLRFDYAGTGNSHGTAVEAAPQVMKRNIHDAVQWMTQRHSTTPVTLLGIRLGATLASQCQHPMVDQRLLWDPVVNGQTFLRRLDDLHSATLVNGSRFSQPRLAGSIDQAYGVRLNHVVRRQLEELKLAPDISTDHSSCTFLLSQDYASMEGIDATHLESKTVVPLSDEIGWHVAHWNESAFASPDAMRKISSLLVSETCSSNQEVTT